MALSACRCTFKRTQNSEIESGTAIARAFGLSDVVAIIPDDATNASNAVVKEIWNYWLDWTHSIDGDRL